MKQHVTPTKDDLFVARSLIKKVEGPSLIFGDQRERVIAQLAAYIAIRREERREVIATVALMLAVLILASGFTLMFIGHWVYSMFVGGAPS